MYRKPPIVPPWGGWNDSGPSLALPSNSFRKITNFLIKDNRIITPPKNSPYALPLPNAGSNPKEVLMGARTFIDVQGFYHTLFLTNYRALTLDSTIPAWVTIFTYRGGAPFPNITSAQLFSIETYQNALYFSNGSFPILRYIGDTTLFAIGPNPPPFPLAVDGDFPGSCFFFGKLAGRLIALNTTESFIGQPGATNHPARIRWSAINNALEWDSTVDPTAGVADLTEVEDQISGWVLINQTGYIFRSNGISAVTATGSAVIPFYVQNFSIGPQGIGCAVNFTLSSYGTIACFVATDNVYSFSGQAPQPIGSTARRAIFKDLELASSQPFGRMLGTFTRHVDYLTYWLCIPQNNDTLTSVWIYHFDDQTWVNVQLPYGAVRCIANVAVS